MWYRNFIPTQKYNKKGYKSGPYKNLYVYALHCMADTTLKKTIFQNFNAATVM